MLTNNPANPRPRFLVLIFLATIPVLGLSTLVPTPFISNVFLRNARVLIKAMQRIRAGDLSTPIKLPYEPEELGQLARTFDAMARALQQREVDHKQIEAALQASQARLSGIIASTMDAVITIDARQRIILFNAAAEQMFYCSAAEALGRPLDQFIPAQFRGSHREHIRTFGRTNVSNRSMGALGTVIGLREWSGISARSLDLAS